MSGRHEDGVSASGARLDVQRLVIGHVRGRPRPNLIAIVFESPPGKPSTRSLRQVRRRYCVPAFVPSGLSSTLFLEVRDAARLEAVLLVPFTGQQRTWMAGALSNMTTIVTFDRQLTVTTLDASFFNISRDVCITGATTQGRSQGIDCPSWRGCR
jgi:hypothetical protein